MIHPHCVYTIEIEIDRFGMTDADLVALIERWTLVKRTSLSVPFLK